MTHDAPEPFVSVLIPLEDHREYAEHAIRAWCGRQTLDRGAYEVIAVASARTPRELAARVARALGPRDRLLVSTSRHDVDLVAEATGVARGRYLFFTESHCWPEPAALERCLTRLRERPEWSGLVCHLARHAPARLSHVEADMYERDFAFGRTTLGWRCINDAAFFTRRAAYDRAGGFDATLGHFAEWALAARYASAGMTIGYAPDITLWHVFAGDVAGVRGFTEDFVRGEATYLARDPHHRRESSIEAPSEWQRRGDRRRDLAGHLRDLVLREFARASFERRPPRATLRQLGFWSAVAFGGATPARVVATARVLRARLRLAASRGRGAALASAWETYLRAVIRRGRSRHAREMLVRTRYDATGAVWLADPVFGNVGAGFFEAERYEGVTFRWSETAAAIALDLSPGRYELIVSTLWSRLGIDLSDAGHRSEFFVDGERVAPRYSETGGALRITVAVRRSGGTWLGWLSPSSGANADDRSLGIPLVSVLAIRAEPAGEAARVSGGS